MQRNFVRGERVLVPHGLESRIIAKIHSGPFKYTDDELEQNRYVSTFHGYSTKRMARSYYCLEYGRGRLMTCSINSIRKLSKRA